jgi:chromosome segregation protein
MDNKKEIETLKSKNEALNKKIESEKIPVPAKTAKDNKEEINKLIKLLDDSKEREKVIKELQDLKAENEYLRSLKNQNANANNQKDQTYYESVLSNLEKEKDDTISKLRNENTKFSKENEELNLKCEKIKRDFEKLKIAYQRTELDKQNLTLRIDRSKNETKRFEEDNKALNAKIKDLNNKKNLEADKIKQEVKEKDKLIEKMLNEKQEIIKKYSDLQKEYSQLKIKFEEEVGIEDENINNENQVLIDINSNENIGSKNEVSNSEILALKNEIQALKFKIVSKDDEIKKLNNSSNKSKFTDDEISSKLSDLDFYKKSYEAQKNRVNFEHELISDSLYKLAKHLMGLKEDLQKKMKQQFKHNSSKFSKKK